MTRMYDTEIQLQGVKNASLLRDDEKIKGKQLFS